MPPYQFGYWIVSAHSCTLSVWKFQLGTGRVGSRFESQVLQLDPYVMGFNVFLSDPGIFD